MMILRRGVNSDPRGGEGAQRHKRLGVLKQSSQRVSERESKTCLPSSVLSAQDENQGGEEGERRPQAGGGAEEEEGAEAGRAA